MAKESKELWKRLAIHERDLGLNSTSFSKYDPKPVTISPSKNYNPNLSYHGLHKYNPKAVKL